MMQAMSHVESRSAETVSQVLAEPRVRLAGIDRLRGLVILLMALDHVRDFFNADALRFDPTDLTQTYPLLFLTRFITHYCAPIFVILAGVSAFLHGTKLDDRGVLARFLLTRGMWLILLDALVVSPVWGVELGRFHLGVLWAIGSSMIALAGLIFLGPPIVLLIGALILVSHNLLDPLHSARFGDWAPLWNLLHESSTLPFGLPGDVFYPVLPWVGIMAKNGRRRTDADSFTEGRERFRENHGEKSFAGLQSKHVQQMLSDRPPHAARNFLKVLRAVAAAALRAGLCETDPTAGLRVKVKASPHGFRTWTEDDIAEFESKYPIGTRARLAFALLLYSAQRRGDVVRMGRQHIRNSTLTVRQAKTGAAVEIPIHAELQRVLEASDCRHLTFLVTATGKPFTGGRCAG